MVVQVDHYSRNQMSMHHHLLVPLHPETEVSIGVIIHRTSRLDRLNLKVVLHKEVVGVTHVEIVVKSTLENVLVAKKFSSSVVKRITS